MKCFLSKLGATAIGVSFAVVAGVISSAPEAKAVCMNGGITAGGMTATACQLVSGSNDNAAAINALGFNSSVYSLLAKVDAPATSNDGLVLSSPSDSSSGTWSIAPAVQNFVAVLKAGNAFQAYYFDSSLGAKTGGEWNTQLAGLVNPKDGKGRSLSHFSIYATDDVASVPEPLTILGTGLALGFGGLMQKKRSNKKHQTKKA